MSIPERVFVALGSNLGDRQAYLAKAREALARIPLTRVLAASSATETAPLGGPPQGPYLNQVVLVETSLDPSRFLKALLQIERDNGRERGERWAPRTLDLDIVRFGTRRLRDPDLIIPHPELPNREFWRTGIEEIERGLKDNSAD